MLTVLPEASFEGLGSLEGDGVECLAFVGSDRPAQSARIVGRLFAVLGTGNRHRALDHEPVERDLARRLAVVGITDSTQLGHDRREVQLTAALAIEKMQDDIAVTLTPGQRSKFEELIAEQRARLQQLRQDEGPRPPRGAQPPPK